MSADTHEDIILQLMTLLGGLTGLAQKADGSGPSVWRDRGDITGIEAPAAILLDGVEVYAMDQDVRRLKSVKMPPAIFTLKPQIFIVLPLNDDPTNLTPFAAGPTLSLWRMKVKAAIENDPTLIGLLTTSGQIAYRGSDTDMQTGSTIGALGAMIQFHYEFSYMLFPPRS